MNLVNFTFFTEGEKGSPGHKGSQGEKGQQGQKGMPGTCDAKVILLPTTSNANYHFISCFLNFA